MQAHLFISVFAECIPYNNASCQTEAGSGISLMRARDRDFEFLRGKDARIASIK